MKIAVLGSRSFIANEIRDYFTNRDITYVDRKIVDLEENNIVSNFFSNNKFDIVINTCIVGGKRGKQDNFDIFTKNIKMFNNLLANKHSYGYLVNFCSGASFDRRENITNAHENEIFIKNPIDYYGSAKNLISRESLKHNNILNLRIFGCFGKYEEENRFIKNSINRLNAGNDILINSNKFIDYVSSTDLCKVIEFYMNNLEILSDVKYRDVNITYEEKQRLSDIAEKILHLKNKKGCVTIAQEDLDKDYTGNCDKLLSLPIKLDGLDISLKRIINCH